MLRYRIQIDTDLCDGDMLCCEEAPATFGLNEDQTAVVLDPSGDPPEDILSAARQCPMAAVTLYDAETGERVWPTTQA